MTMNKAHLEKVFQANWDRYLTEWKEFLSFKSISADPSYNKDCESCASWLVDHLKNMGFSSRLLHTSGKPVVFAEYRGTKNAPQVLFYGHYDVQPADPLNLWASDPFSAELRDGRLYARGAEDNKGQVFYFLKAVEHLIKEKVMPCSLKIFLEGEEESSSKGLTEALPSWKELVKGDILMVCDTGCLKPNLPTITMGLRGIVALEARLSGIMRDLHSGVYGGMVKNPAIEMARLIATLHDQNGKIAVKDFLEMVKEPSPEDRALANAIPIDPLDVEKAIGVKPNGGEKGYTIAERRGFRPTIEVNGMYSGYTGKGGKTIIPSSATVKITSRIVGGQDPEKSLAAIIRHLEAHAPEGLKLEIVEKGVGGPALLLSSKASVIQRAKSVLQEIFSSEVAFTWEGASIPIVSLFAEVSGAEPLLIGFGHEEDNIHAPNESFSIEQFKKGFLYSGMYLSGL